jgi:hypothetical protein
MKNDENLRREYAEWKEQTLATLEELCAAPGTALERASEASGNRELFVQKLFSAIDRESFRGTFTTDYEVGPEFMLKWLEAIRSDEAWTGKVPFAKEGHASLNDSFYEDNFESLDDYTFQSMELLIESFLNSLRKEGLDAAAGAVFAEEDDIRNELLDSGIISSDFEMKSHGFNCNIILGYKEEGNFDFGVISGFRTMYLAEDPPTDEVIGNNSLSWLIRSQDYSVADLYSDMKSPFLDSVRREIEEYTAGMGGVTICLRLSADELEALASNNGKNISISKEASIGIFTPWSGAGSLMEIALEKDIVLPKSMINRIQVEGAKNNEYTVDEVYGMTGRFWTQHAMKTTDDAPFEMTDDMVAADVLAMQENLERAEEDASEDSSPSP